MRQNINNPCGGKYGKSIDVKFINECNGNCKFCIEKGGLCPSNRSIKEMIKSITSPILNDYDNVLILGGEPALDPEGLLLLCKEIVYFKDIYITTNGTSIQDKYLNQIANYVNAVNISIMHYDYLKNKRIMGVSNTKEDLIRMINIYKSRGCKVRINCNLYKGGVDSPEELDKMLDYCEELGVDTIKISELQGIKKNFIRASDIIDGVHMSPYEQGCEQNIRMPYHFSGKIILKTTCGLCNSLSPMPIKLPENLYQNTKVVYCDGSINNNWVYLNTKKIIKDRIKFSEKTSINRSHCGEDSTNIYRSHCGNCY